MTREDITKNMARTIEVVIRISEEDFKIMKHNIAVNKPLCPLSEDKMVSIVANGTPLPKHGDLYDKAEILRFLKCPKYENCDWKNCFDCNESRCINLNNIYDLVPIIKADKESEKV